MATDPHGKKATKSPVFVIKREPHKRPVKKGLRMDGLEQGRKLHVLVVAHPDDESMFFLPTLNALQSAGETVWVVCLTTGNYDGLGDIRKKEMLQVCQLLKIVKLLHLEVEALQDHPTKAWSLDAVAFHIEQALRTGIKQCDETFERIVLITFDFFGVSGHSNHRDTYLGVRHLFLQSQLQTTKRDTKGKTQGDRKAGELSELPPLEAWMLESVHFLPSKYLPIIEWMYLALYLCALWKPKCLPLPKLDSTTANEQDTSRLSRTFRSPDPLRSWRAMRTHHSQFVWYRRLFVIFSCYTFVNVLHPIR